MPPLQPNHSFTDLSDLKSRIWRKVGTERAKRYFSCLNGLLGQKLQKNEFDKLCFAILGRENIPLHNQFIRSILRNAHQRRTSRPVTCDKDALRPNKASVKLSSSTGDGTHPPPINMPTPPTWTNGDILPPSPRKCRSASRRLKDRPSPLGLGSSGKTEAVGRLCVPLEEADLMEDSVLANFNFRRQAQHPQGGHIDLLVKKQEKSSPCDQMVVESLAGKHLAEVAVKDVKDVEQIDFAESGRATIQAPLGISFRSASSGGSCRCRSVHLSASNTDGIFGSSYCSSELCDTETLRKHMEHIAETQGLQHVTVDCANMLNNGLDAYLKRLITSCTNVAGSRSITEQIKHPVSKHQAQLKNLNGIWTANHMNIQSTVGSFEGIHEAKSSYPVTLLDFRVAMELKPQLLGKDWQLLLEKICHR